MAKARKIKNLAGAVYTMTVSESMFVTLANLWVLDQIFVRREDLHANVAALVTRDRSRTYVRYVRKRRDDIINILNSILNYKATTLQTYSANEDVNKRNELNLNILVLTSCNL